MLDPQDKAGAHRTVRYSLARDIVELIVLTTDDIFLLTLREAIGVSRRLWHVPTADKVSDLLIAGGVGILVLDAQALAAEALNEFIAGIKRQFPDLVVVVAGSREAEGLLAPLISAGAVYRYIHKPLSPGRARIFADVAVKKYIGQRREDSSRSVAATGDRARRGPWIYAACAVASLAIALVVEWMAHHAHEPQARTKSPAAAVPLKSPAVVDRRNDDPEADSEGLDRLMSQAEGTLSAQFAKSLQQHQGSATAAQPRIAAGQDGALSADRGVERSANSAPEAAAPEPAASKPPQLQPAQPQLPQAPLPQLETPQQQTPPAQAAQQQPSPPKNEAPPSQDSNTAEAPAKSAEERKAQDHALEPAPDPSLGQPKNELSASAGTELTLLTSVPPAYPLAAERRGTEGWVDLEFTVAESGVVKDIAVRAAAPSGVFEQAAVRALSQWRYKPVLQDGRPAAPRAHVRIRFTLAR